MPIIKSAIRQMKKSLKNQEKNLPLKTKVKTVFKTNLQMISEGKVDDAKKQLSRTYKVIDMAVKKHLLHKNTASRRKARLAREIKALEEKVAK
ncbi:MAG: 30S ribosomal protein S20 [Candidatus Gracilibacteria bacterium]|nr:30S ribosomal protein S20 [Candidatus Gracilibacteria bacterium]